VLRVSSTVRWKLENALYEDRERLSASEARVRTNDCMAAALCTLQPRRCVLSSQRLPLQAVSRALRFGGSNGCVVKVPTPSRIPRLLRNSMSDSRWSRSRDRATRASLAPKPDRSDAAVIEMVAPRSSPHTAERQQRHDGVTKQVVTAVAKLQSKVRSVLPKSVHAGIGVVKFMVYVVVCFSFNCADSSARPEGLLNSMRGRTLDAGFVAAP